MQPDFSQLKDKKVLVTGGAGFIGSHITEILLNAGANVIVLDNLFNGTIENVRPFMEKPNFKFIQGDVRDGSFLIELCKGIDIIFHEGAFISVTQSITMPQFCHDTNVTGTFNVLNAARIANVDRVVFASSAAIYGDNPELPKHEGMLPEALTPYGASKLAGESYMTTFFNSYGLKTTALRYFNVYGPRQRNSAYAGVMVLFIEKILRSGKNPTIFGDGTQTRDFVYVKDIVKANIMAALHPKSPGQIFNVATGNTVDLNSLTKKILKYTGRSDLEIIYGPARKGDILHSSAKISKIESTIGFKADYSIDTGLQEYIAYVKKEMGIKN